MVMTSSKWSSVLHSTMRSPCRCQWCYCKIKFLSIGSITRQINCELYLMVDARRIVLATFVLSDTSSTMVIHTIGTLVTSIKLFRCFLWNNWCWYSADIGWVLSLWLCHAHNLDIVTQNMRDYLLVFTLWFDIYILFSSLDSTRLFLENP
jgi:hypothetical protein